MKNLIIRTISGIVYLGIILGALLWHPLAFVVIFSIIMSIMMFEYLDISLGSENFIGQLLSVTTGILLFVITFFFLETGNIDPKFFAIPLISLLFIFISALYKQKGSTVTYLTGAIIYIALPFTLMNLLVFSNSEFSGIFMLFLFILLWANDVGAYIFGMLFGQKNGHKLFPSISPKKSWEGFWGGVVISLLAGFIIFKCGLIEISLLHTLIISIIVVIFGTYGDLVESQIKRNFGVKDSGKIMPGHGGLLDRLDGALLAFPAVVIYITLTGIV